MPALTLLLVPFILGGCSQPAPPLQDLYEVPQFSLIAQNGEPVQRADLLGKVWVAGFIFTRCGGPCPQVTANMARLQQELGGQQDARLVTVTVDPEHDTPEVLTRYGKSHGADPERWLFLSGKQEDVYRLVHDGFHLGMESVKSDVIHSTKLVVVDRRGHIRGYFDGRQRDDTGNALDEVPQVKQAVLQLLKEKP